MIEREPTASAANQTIRSPAPRRRSGRRRSAYVALIALGLGLMMEAGSALALRRVDGAWPSFARFRLEQGELAGTSLQSLNANSLRPSLPNLKGDSLHPYLGYLPKLRDGEHPRRRKVYEHGFYADDHPLFQPSSDTAVVGITGGSLALMFFDDATKLLAERLRQAKEFHDKELFFVALCYGGAKQPQQLMMLNYVLALGGQLDLLINLDGFNEIALHGAENAKKDVFAPYPRSWFHRVSPLPDASFSILHGRVAYLTARRVAAAVAARDSLWSRSLSYQLLWKMRDRSLQAEIQAGEQALAEYRPTASYRETGPRWDGPGDADPYEFLADVWMNSSLALDQLCRANGIRYLHCLQPNQYVPGSKLLTEEERKIAYRENHVYRTGVVDAYGLLQARGERLQAFGVDFLDLTAVFADVTETIYKDNCCHINSRGNQILAEAILRHL